MKSRHHTISSAAALWLIECVRQRGKPVKALFAAAGLDPAHLPTSDEHLAAERYLELWDAAMRLVDDPAFAVRAGASFDLGALGIFGFLAISCETLGDAYRRTVPMRSLYNVGASWELETRRDRLRLSWSAWPLKSKAAGARAMNEYQVAEMLAAMRQMTKQRLVPKRVAFTHEAADAGEAWRETFGVMPEFGADFCGFEADASWLSLQVRTGNAKLRDYFERQCTEVKAAFARDPPFAAEVRQRLVASMNGERAGVREIARSLAMTERTLQRRLTDEGTGFTQVLDEVRREFAERYLARPHLSVGEVGWLTGFNDASSFFKAFRRWTGLTPGAWRERQTAR
jgi:AraC-like DNA-binding protein